MGVTFSRVTLQLLKASNPFPFSSTFLSFILKVSLIQTKHNMPEEPLMAGALPVPSQDPAHRNAREPRPARHAESRPSARDRHLNPGTNAAEPTIFVTPPSLPQLHSPSDRNGHLSLAESISHHDSGARSVVPATHLAPPFQQQGSHSSGQSKPSNQPLRSTNEDHRGPARGPSSSTNRNINQPPAVPNYSPPNPTPQQNLGSAEPPMRITSVRPPDDPTPTGRRMTDQEADTVCKKLCSRIWNENMGKFYDKVVEADRRGNVDDKLYYQLLDFFYCFLPVIPSFPLHFLISRDQLLIKSVRWWPKLPRAIQSLFALRISRIIGKF